MFRARRPSIFHHISQNATPATEFAPCRHLTQPWQCDSQKKHYTTRLQRCACHEKLLNFASEGIWLKISVFGKLVSSHVFCASWSCSIAELTYLSIWGPTSTTLNLPNMGAVLLVFWIGHLMAYLQHRTLPTWCLCWLDIVSTYRTNVRAQLNSQCANGIPP